MMAFTNGINIASKMDCHIYLAILFVSNNHHCVLLDYNQ